MNSYDVVVIGAGVIGSSVAFHLSKLGARNVLVL
ncbi:FAD-dependent oxidoreductase, partial [Escherichia coli]